MLFNETILNVSKWQISIGSAAKTEFTFLYYNLNSLSSHITAKNLWNQNKEASFRPFAAFLRSREPSTSVRGLRQSEPWTVDTSAWLSVYSNNNNKQQLLLQQQQIDQTNI